jgi:hypothetical protein
MVCCSPLIEAAASMAELENMDNVVIAMEVVRMIGEGCLSIPDAADDSLGKGGSDDENSQTYYFRSSTITVDKIKEMVEKGDFLEGKACAPRAEMVPEPDSDEAIVYENFFCCRLMHAFASCFS